MPLPVVFASLPAGDNPASLIDTQFTALAGFSVIPCSATGLNDIELAPFADAPIVTQYSDLSPLFTFMATQTSSGNVTLNVSGLGAHPAFKNNGTAPAGANDVVAGGIYRAAFLTALNGGAGGFVID